MQGSGGLILPTLSFAPRLPNSGRPKYADITVDVGFRLGLRLVVGCPDLIPASAIEHAAKVYVN